VIQELGLYSWNPGPHPNRYLKEHRDVTVVDLKQRLLLSDIKPPVVNLDRLNFPIELVPNLPAQGYPRQYPHEHGYIVPLMAAAKRGVSPSVIDFVLGGSSLAVFFPLAITRYI